MPDRPQADAALALARTTTDAAQTLAERAAVALWAGDRASRGLGMEIISVGPGAATLSMLVRDDMVNGLGTAHGGVLFTLADSAFQFACNSAGETTVGAHCSMTFIRPARPGDRLLATARAISRAGRSGIYDVQIIAAEQVIAEFRGHSRTTGGSFLGGS